ncbi:hypothetical protein DPMN_172613 [Dreissena polymorpha]|uniref:Uncharacterized protein n=1 Tax=Dreissena polymorpha TaxID=45954 RepID=A0A9D4E390_DREPO|nr:hypothetical protein DPMN_172613 [Dreissena polymorpha]
MCYSDKPVQKSETTASITETAINGRYVTTKNTVKGTIILVIFRELRSLATDPFAV